jgi:hypothetical protein
VGILLNSSAKLLVSLPIPEMIPEEFEVSVKFWFLEGVYRVVLSIPEYFFKTSISLLKTVIK